MTITRGNKTLETVLYRFEDGEVSGIQATVNVQLLEDGEELTRVREEVDIWSSMNAGERTAANAVGKKIRSKAGA